MSASARRDTREDILACSIDLFARKGYTETSMREIAQAVAIQPGSIYNHFTSKQEILEQILSIYSSHFTSKNIGDKRIVELLSDASIDKILGCMSLEFEPDSADRFRKILYIILHEQYRNDVVREYVRNSLIIQNEAYVRMVVDSLVAAQLIEPVDSELLAKLHVATVYYWASANLLGLDATPPFLMNHTMAGVLRCLYETYVIFK